LKRREDGGHFGSLFALVLAQLTLRKAWPTVLGPLEALMQVEEIARVKPPGVNFRKHTHTFILHTFYPARPASGCHAVRFCPRTSSRRRIGVTLNSPTKGRVEMVQLNCCDTTINWKYPFLTGPEREFESDSCKWICMSFKN